MSEDNAPKLRLKPKLAADPSTAQASPAEPAAPAQPADAAPKLVRLKPKLTPAPAQETTAAPVAEPAVSAESPAEAPETVRLRPRLSAAPVETPAAEPVPAPEPAPAAPEPEAPPSAPEPAAKPAFKLGLKAKSAAAASAPAPETPPVAETEQPPTLDAPPPPPREAETDDKEKGEPGETTSMPRVTAAPFPAPGKFPPPPGLKRALDDAKDEVSSQADGKGKKGGFKEKLFKYGVIALLLLGALAWKAGKYFLDRTVTATIENKLFDKKEPAAPAPTPATPQGQAVATTKAVVDQAKEQTAAPVKEILEGEPKTAGQAGTTLDPATPKPTEEVKPAEPPPPPPPSVAFRGWVENLKISGVRGGATPRIFIGGSSYQPGDLVNPQLGITFVGYNDTTRLLTFRDKSGAKIERRN